MRVSVWVTTLSSTLRETYMYKTLEDGGRLAFPMSGQFSLTSAEQWLRNDAAEKSKAMEISWDFPVTLENFTFVLWALGSHREYLNREKDRPLSGFRNITVRSFVQSAGRRQDCRLAFQFGCYRVWAGKNGRLEEDNVKGRGDSGEFRRKQRQQEAGRSGSREEPGVAARFQQRHTRKGGAPSTLALDPGVVPTHGLPAFGPSSQKLLPSHQLYGLHAIHFHQHVLISYYVPGTTEASPSHT